MPNDGFSVNEEKGMKIKRPTAVILAASVLFAVLMTGWFIGGRTARHFVYVKEVEQMPPAQSTARQFNINTATVRELAELDGVSEDLAERIVTKRALRGSFDSVEQLLTVEGFSERLLASLREVLTVE